METIIWISFVRTYVGYQDEGIFMECFFVNFESKILEQSQFFYVRAYRSRDFPNNF